MIESYSTMPGVLSQFTFLWVGDGYIITPSYIPNKKSKNQKKKIKKNSRRRRNLLTFVAKMGYKLQKYS